MVKLQTIRELLLEFEKCETAKEVINKISDKYKYKKPQKKEYSKDELLKQLYKENKFKTAKDVITYLATFIDDCHEDIIYSLNEKIDRTKINDITTFIK
jgi:hypothetical protein